MSQNLRHLLQNNKYNNQSYNSSQQIGGEFTKNLKNTDFIRPKITLTDTLQSTSAMREKLKNYIRVNNIDDVRLGTHVRYVTWKNGKQRFCLGGILKEVHSAYVKLANKSFHWSVQKQHFDNNRTIIFNTVFFRVLSKSERGIDKEELQLQSQQQSQQQSQRKYQRQNKSNNQGQNNQVQNNSKQLEKVLKEFKKLKKINEKILLENNELRKYYIHSQKKLRKQSK
tara:strand:+ start:2140 stop:2817 length:678 start_codon:yes stop_codon:yes gene_type:complete